MPPPLLLAPPPHHFPLLPPRLLIVPPLPLASFASAADTVTAASPCDPSTALITCHCAAAATKATDLIILRIRPHPLMPMPPLLLVPPLPLSTFAAALLLPLPLFSAATDAVAATAAFLSSDSTYRTSHTSCNNQQKPNAIGMGGSQRTLY